VHVDHMYKQEIWA